MASEVSIVGIDELPKDILLIVCQHLVCPNDYRNLRLTNRGINEKCQLSPKECERLLLRYITAKTGWRFKEIEQWICAHHAKWPEPTLFLFKRIVDEFSRNSAELGSLLSRKTGKPEFLELVWQRLTKDNQVDIAIELGIELVEAHLTNEQLNAAIPIWEAVWQSLTQDGGISLQAAQTGLRLVGKCVEKGRLNDARRIWEAIWQDPIQYKLDLPEAAKRGLQLVALHEKISYLHDAVEIWQLIWRKSIKDKKVLDEAAKTGLQLVALHEEPGCLHDAMEIWEICQKYISKSSFPDEAIEPGLKLAKVLEKNEGLNDAVKIWTQLATVCEEKGRQKEAFKIWKTIWRGRSWDGHIPDEVIMPGLKLVEVDMRSGQLDEAMKVWKVIWRELVVHEKNERMDGTVEISEACWKKWIRYCNVSNLEIEFGLQLVTELQRVRRLEDAMKIWEIIWRTQTSSHPIFNTTINLGLQLAPMLRETGRLYDTMEIWEHLAAVHGTKRMGDVGKDWDIIWQRRSQYGFIPRESVESKLNLLVVYEFLDKAEKIWKAMYEKRILNRSITENTADLGLELAKELQSFGWVVLSMKIWDQIAAGDE